MSGPVRLQLSRRAGFGLQGHSRSVNGRAAVVVARPSRWGNPHRVLRCWFHAGIPAWGDPPFEARTAAEADAEGARIAVELFRREVAPHLDVTLLRGLNLGCWCKLGAPCHGNVLLEFANGPACEEASGNGHG